MRFTANIYINVGKDNFFGYRPGAPLAHVEEFVVDGVDANYAAGAMWAIGNKEAADANGKRYPHDVRSLSVGDVLTLKSEDGFTMFACASVGWDELPEMANPIVPLAGQDPHTSRPAAVEG